MKSYRQWAQRVAFAAVLCMIVGPVRAQGPKPAVPGAALRPGAVDAAMKYAPENAAGLIHVELKALVKDVAAAFAKEPEFKSIDANTLEVLVKFGEKIDSLDVFLIAGEGGFGNFLAVVHGPLAPADVNRAVKALWGESTDFLVQKEEGVLVLPPKEAGKPPDRRLEKPKGRYTTAAGELPFEFVFGGESPDLPAGVVIVGAYDSIPPEALAKLGKGKNEPLIKLLAGVDAAAPIWAGVSVGKLDPSEDAPATISGSVYLLGGGKSKLEMAYKDANFAAEAMKDLQDPNRMDVSWSMLLRCIGELSLDGTAVRFVPKQAEAVLPKLVTALADMRRENRKALSEAYLSHIGGTMAEYSADHDDMLPADLLDLVKERAIPAQMLVSPVTGRAVKVDANGLLVGAFESDYVMVKYPMSSLKIKDRAKRVLAYERPENYKKAGTLVLYVDEHVDWVKMEEFEKQLKATQDWIAAQAKDATTKEK